MLQNSKDGRKEELEKVMDEICELNANLEQYKDRRDSLQQ